MERYNRSVWKGTACQYEKVEQVSMERYNSSVWKGTTGQYGKVQQVSLERYSRVSMGRYNRSV